ncbi:lytic transglycosylase domain-containing protein [Fibrella aquatica]|uniref:lytic transglycosylase domain-containing protein n=1 Tax=Fibrella aquatica TaxID=3242487 RepID=UPI00352232F2
MKSLARIVLAISFIVGHQVLALADSFYRTTAPSSNRACFSRTYLALVLPHLDLPLPRVHFCGEVVPMHEQRVARQLISALSRSASQASSLIRMRQRATAFFPIIEPVLEKYHIPLDFKYLPLVESALVGTAVSPKGAAGYWQLMPATARELGLTVKPYKDERLNLMRSTDAACRYLRYLHDQLGSWTLAAAAYNTGIGNLLGNIRRQQKRDYYYLRLNAETGKYLYRILAFKELFNNTLQYRDLLPHQLLASLNQPVGAETPGQAEEVLFDEEVLVNMEREAVTTATPLATITPSDDNTEDIPLPNAADVFRGGIKAKLTEAGELRRGAIWVFNLTRNGVAEDVTVNEGDRLYAVVEDIDPKTGKIFFRADKLYTAGSQQTMALPLAAVDASTGRMGIKLPDVDQIKAGWILTWKVL